MVWLKDEQIKTVMEVRKDPNESYFFIIPLFVAISSVLNIYRQEAICRVYHDFTGTTFSNASSSTCDQSQQQVNNFFWDILTDMQWATKMGFFLIIIWMNILVHWLENVPLTQQSQIEQVIAGATQPPTSASVGGVGNNSIGPNAN